MAKEEDIVVHKVKVISHTSINTKATNTLKTICALKNVAGLVVISIAALQVMIGLVINATEIFRIITVLTIIVIVVMVALNAVTMAVIAVTLTLIVVVTIVLL